MENDVAAVRADADAAPVTASDIIATKVAAEQISQWVEGVRVTTMFVTLLLSREPGIARCFWSALGEGSHGVGLTIGLPPLLGARRERQPFATNAHIPDRTTPSPAQYSRSDGSRP